MAGRPRRREVGLLEVAREAGVSTATVSNTLNRPDIVTPATRGRVMAAIQRLDFVPNHAAGTLRRGHNRLFGLVVPDITNPFYAEIARGVTDAAESSGLAVVLCNSQDDPARERRQLEMLAEHRAAGALVVPIGADRRRLDRLRRMGVHLVLIDRRSAPGDGCSVVIEDRAGGSLAMAHLIDTTTGDGPLAIVNSSRTIPQCAERDLGARDALDAAGSDPDRLVCVEIGLMTTAQGVLAADQLARSARPPRGVFCTNDQLAIGVIRGLSAAGLRVPEDVAVVGYGDLAIAVDAPVPLTTVELPKYSLGQSAVAKLMTELAEGEHHRHSTTVFPPSLVVRESAPAAGAASAPGPASA